MVLAFVGILGLCIGSFLNVVAYRLPRECMSIARPGSRCPRCATPIAWYDNLPVVSWMLLKARCRHCGVRISARYPLVELSTAGLFVLAAMAVLGGPDGPAEKVASGNAWLTLGVVLVITSALIALSLVDLDYRILPDEITKPGIVLGWFLAFLAPELQHGRYALRLLENGEWALRGNAAANGILGTVVAGGTLYLIGWLGTKAFKKDAMGLGDVKMIAAMGGVLGLWSLLALGVAAISGALVGLAVRIATKGRYIPFGPFLGLGMWVVMLWGPEVLEAWLGIFRRP